MSDKYTVEQITAKIQKLLNLAADPNANEHIAEQAAAKAQELMQQWAIDEASLPGEKAADPFTFEEVPYLKGTKRQTWEDYLAAHVGKAMMCHPHHNDKKAVFIFAGHSRDVKVAVFTFCMLRNTLETLSRCRLSEHGAEIKLKYNKSIYNAQQCRAFSGHHPTVYRSRWLDSWLDGAQKGVGVKLAEQQQTTVQSSTALMVVETRAAESEDWATEKFKLTQSKAFKARKAFADATNQGFKDGKAIELRKGLEVEEIHQIEGK